MDDFKYTLIVSQYRHSYHSFIVKHDGKTFLENAKNFVTELEDYKRDEERKTGENLGDLIYKTQDVIYTRYNINDQGDIYFLNAVYVNSLMHDLLDYHETGRRFSQGYKKKGVEESISKHHSFWKVKEILQKHFEIA